MTPVRSFVLGLSLVLGTLLVGCGEAKPEPGPVVEPDLAAKADVARGVVRLGPLDFGRYRTRSFSRDLEFHGYTFIAGEGASVKLDVTHEGSSARLDTTLFLYGPKSSGGTFDKRIAQDDDSGWGGLSRLTTGPLAAGEYLVVVGTKDGLGRGHYRLTLSCASGVCGGEKLELSDVPLPADLAERADSAWENCDPCGISVNVYRYSYPGTANLAQVTHSLRATLEQPSEWVDEKLVVTPEVAQEIFKFSYLDGMLEPLMALVGSRDFEGTSLLFDGTTEDGWALYATVLILHFPATQSVVTLYFGQISG